MRQKMVLWDFCRITDGWRDNYVIIFYTMSYTMYTEYTNKVQFQDLQVAGWRSPFG
jgi:hypothetical protein